MKGHVAFRYGGHCTFTNRKVKQLAATDSRRCDGRKTVSKAERSCDGECVSLGS